MNGDLYRAFWRWHFYAGLFVLPFLALLAVTGSIYLFKPEVERLVYGNWIVLDAPARPLPASKLIAATERQAHGGLCSTPIRGCRRSGQCLWREIATSSDSWPCP